MKKILSIITAILFIISFTACNGSEKTADEKQPVQEQQVTSPTSVTPTETPKPADQNFAFWAKKVEVNPIVINENDTWGEGQEPAISVSYTFYFTDSAENTKEWQMSASYFKTKPTDSAKMVYYRQDVEDFNNAKKLYDEVTKIPEGRIFVEGTGKNVTIVSKGTDLTVKKIGTAAIRQDATTQLWSYYSGH